MAWLTTDALKKTDCPKCKSVKGDFCRTPKGRKLYELHTERMIALRSIPGFNENDYINGVDEDGNV